MFSWFILLTAVSAREKIIVAIIVLLPFPSKKEIKRIRKILKKLT